MKISAVALAMLLTACGGGGGNPGTCFGSEEVCSGSGSSSSGPTPSAPAVGAPAPGTTGSTSGY